MYYILTACVCSLSYPARNAHAPYYIIICMAVVCFSTLSHKRYDFRKKKLLNTKCEFRFSLQILYKIILILRSTERHMIINVHTPSCRVQVILVRLLWNMDFFDRFSKKCSNVKFHEIPSNGSPAVPCGMFGQTNGRTDGQTDRRG
jgi:hypothetical protein